MKYLYSPIMICLILLTAASSAFADTRYISDQLVVTVRSSPGDSYDVLETLRTDTPVEALEDLKNFVKVKTPQGTVGYISSQYVTKDKPKSLQIAALEKEKKRLQDQLANLEQECQANAAVADSSQSQLTELTTQLEQTRTQLEQVKSEYQSLQESSQGVIELSAERDQLDEENSRLSSELEVLREENKQFHRSNMIKWFLAGGGVFFFGWLVGKLSRKKRGFGRL